jgi:hypothetical protein
MVVGILEEPGDEGCIGFGKESTLEGPTPDMMNKAR